MRTPDSRRVKTLWLQGTVPTVAAGVETVTTSHTFQDDVRVIGCHVEANSIVTDAQLNADGRMHTQGEVSKHGVQGHDGALLRAQVFAGWTAAIAIGNLLASEQVVFPEGYGVDFDDGETIYLHGQLENIGAVTGVGLVVAIIYYVER